MEKWTNNPHMKSTIEQAILGAKNCNCEKVYVAKILESDMIVSFEVGDTVYFYSARDSDFKESKESLDPNYRFAHVEILEEVLLSKFENGAICYIDDLSIDTEHPAQESRQFVFLNQHQYEIEVIERYFEAKKQMEDLIESKDKFVLNENIEYLSHTLYKRKK